MIKKEFFIPEMFSFLFLVALLTFVLLMTYIEGPDDSEEITLIETNELLRERVTELQSENEWLKQRIIILEEK